MEIEEYMHAYLLCHGVPPVISKSGSWIVIGEGTFALKRRKSDLPAMTSQLKYRTSQKEELE